MESSIESGLLGRYTPEEERKVSEHVKERTRERERIYLVQDQSSSKLSSTLPYVVA